MATAAELRSSLDAAEWCYRDGDHRLARSNLIALTWRPDAGRAAGYGAFLLVSLRERCEADPTGFA